MDGCRGEGDEGGDEEWGKGERDRWEDEMKDGFRQEEMKRCKDGAMEK